MGGREKGRRGEGEGNWKGGGGRGVVNRVERGELKGRGKRRGCRPVKARQGL